MAFAQDATTGAIVRELVRSIPRGKATNYATIGRAAAAMGRSIGGARTVAWILAALKGRDRTPWHRVVGAGGVVLLPDHRGALQVSRLRREGVRFSKGVIEPRFLVDEAQILKARLLAGAEPSGELKKQKSSRRRSSKDVELLLAQQRVRFDP